MINYLVRSFLMGLSKVQVVQSNPGSLRIRINGLEKGRYFFREYESVPFNFNFYKLYGIENIEISPHSSIVLIEYDPSILRESQILNWLARLKEIIIQRFTSGEKNISQQLIDQIKSDLINEGYNMK